MNRTVPLLVGTIAVGSLGVALGVAINVAHPLTAPIFGADTGNYDPAREPMFRHVTGVACSPESLEKENHILDDAIAKAGYDLALKYADWLEVAVLNRGAKGANQERIMRAKMQQVKKAPLFSRERRIAIGEWYAMHEFLDKNVHATRAPIPEGPRTEILKDASAQLQCKSSVDRLRDRVHLLQTQSALSHVEPALGRFREDFGRFPSTEEGGLQALLKAPVSAKPGQWKGPYLSAEYLKDGWDRDLKYTDLARGEMYRVGTYGADGTKGGRDGDEDFSIMGSARIAERFVDPQQRGATDAPAAPVEPSPEPAKTDDSGDSDTQ